MLFSRIRNIAVWNNTVLFVRKFLFENFLFQFVKEKSRECFSLIYN